MIVTLARQTLDLSHAPDAETFTNTMHASYGEAAYVEWGREMMFAAQTLSMHTFDNSFTARPKAGRCGGSSTRATR